MALANGTKLKKSRLYGVTTGTLSTFYLTYWNLHLLIPLEEKFVFYYLKKFFIFIFCIIYVVLFFQSTEKTQSVVYYYYYT